MIIPPSRILTKTVRLKIHQYVGKYPIDPCLLEHYQVLLELAPKGRKLSFLDIEVEGKPLASGNLG